MIFFIFFLLGLVSVVFVTKPYFSCPAEENQEFDERSLRERVYQDRISELRHERLILDSVESVESVESIENELGLVYLSENQDRKSMPREAPNILGRSSMFFLLVPFFVLALAGVAYIQVGGFELLKVRGAEELLSFDPERDKAKIEEWIVRLSTNVIREPTESNTWYLLGHAYLKVGRYKLANGAFEEAHELFENNLNILSYWLQSRYLDSGTLDQRSRDIINKIGEIDPGHLAVREILGLDALKQGNTAIAITEFNKAISASNNVSHQISLAAVVGEARKRRGKINDGIRVGVKSDSGVPANSTVFVIARPVGGGMPYAVVKRPNQMLPFSVMVDDLVSMQAGRLLSEAESFEIAVRISQSGMAAPSKGDWLWVSRELTSQDYHANSIVEAGLTRANLMTLD